MFTRYTKETSRDVLVDKQGLQKNRKLSYEYIRGLIEGEGCFTFHPGWTRSNGRKSRFPAFALSMHERDKELIEMVRNTLGLKNKVYIQNSYQKDGYKRGRKATLVVRDFEQLKNIIIPLFHKKLKGYKSKQFIFWLEKIGNDSDISDRYKSLHRIYKWGIYDEPKFINKFVD